MNTLRFLPVIVSLAAMLAAGQSSAATIPAGTKIDVQTTSTITSVDAPGTRVPAVLASPLSANGRAVAPAGSKVVGKVVTSRRQASSKERLTVDITEISFNGRAHPIRTTGPVLVDNQNWKTKTGGTVTRGGYSVRAGRQLQFQLAQPLVF